MTLTRIHQRSVPCSQSLTCDEHTTASDGLQKAVRSLQVGVVVGPLVLLLTSVPLDIPSFFNSVLHDYMQADKQVEAALTSSTEIISDDSTMDEVPCPQARWQQQRR